MQFRIQNSGFGVHGLGIRVEKVQGSHLAALVVSHLRDVVEVEHLNHE